MTLNTTSTSHVSELAESSFGYRIVSAKHMPELQEHIDRLYREGRLSDNQTFRSYLDKKGFVVPDSFPDAESLIVDKP